jgi:hypothetical protein
MIIANAASEEERYRSFFYIFTKLITNRNSFTNFTIGQILVLPAAFVAKIIAAFLMTHSIWIPLAVGIAFLFLVLMILSFIPLDQHTRTTLDSQSQSRQDDQRVQERSPNIDQARYKYLLQRIEKTRLQIFTLSFRVSFLIATFLATSIFGHLMAGTVFLQFVEKQLHMDIADARNPPIPFIESQANSLRHLNSKAGMTS